jgi:transcriptional regulator with XRE-family HTH domain
MGVLGSGNGMAHRLYQIANLADARIVADMTQLELAAISNVSIKTISEIENDEEKKVRFRTLRRLERGLGPHGSTLTFFKVN